MDLRLVAWARAVKARRRKAATGRESVLPPLWLFTDAQRLPDPRPVVARLPRGLCGVVFRHDSDPDRAALGRELAALCRARRAVLVVAGDWRLARMLGAGLHLRAGRGSGRRAVGPVTSSAHKRIDLVRARQAGAHFVFLSPVFPTPSHPGASVLGPIRWGLAARGIRLPVAALGGIDGWAVTRMPRRCAGAGAISAM
jgi:thiamine-phosphate pyrophosphorylase